MIARRRGDCRHLGASQATQLRDLPQAWVNTKGTFKTLGPFAESAQGSGMVRKPKMRSGFIASSAKGIVVILFLFCFELNTKIDTKFRMFKY